MFVWFVCVVCCQVKVSATDLSFVQRSPTDCGASLCVIEKPRERGGHNPHWAAEPERERERDKMYVCMYVCTYVITHAHTYVSKAVNDTPRCLPHCGGIFISYESICSTNLNIFKTAVSIPPPAKMWFATRGRICE
jgi:hypothetical protein